MIRGHDFASAVTLCLANGVLLGLGLAAARPAYYVALAAGVGTLANLAYVVAGRLWQRP